MEYFLATLFGYIVGSVPFSYLYPRLFSGKDIRREGTGNVGTFNVLRTTGSKAIGLLALASDLAKGFLGIWAGRKLFGSETLLVIGPALVMGHVVPVWLKFQGGRGLATLGGIFLYFKFWIVLSWLAMFGIIYAATRKYILAAVSAILMANLLILFLLPENLIFISAICSLIVIFKYRNRLRQELNAKGNGDGTQKDRFI